MRPAGGCRVGCALISIVCAIANAAPAAFDVREIASGVFVHEGKPVALDAAGHDDIANIGFVVGRRCVVVIDTGGSMRTGRALRAAIAAHTKVPVCYVINTHVHVDHVLGNSAFKADKPAFVGSAKLVAAIDASRSYFVEHYAADFDTPASTDQVIGPDTTVATTRSLDLGGRTLTLRAWPKAHTDSDLTIMVDDAGVLWTGDLLFVGRVPAVDGSAKGWLAAIDELGKMKATFVVPGHGPVTHDLAAALAPERRYLEVLVDGVRQEIAAGQPIEHATAHVGESEKENWQLWDAANARNVSRVYRELEWE
ncbi:MAG TPA: quinoprotein relay system zinc metallohydrolase 2 [Rhodanobacteraceae bacterium]